MLEFWRMRSTPSNHIPVIYAKAGITRFYFCTFRLNHYAVVGVYMGKVDIRYLNLIGGARGIMVIVVGNDPGDASSNPGRD